MIGDFAIFDSDSDEELGLVINSKAKENLTLHEEKGE